MQYAMFNKQWHLAITWQVGDFTRVRHKQAITNLKQP